MLLKAEVTLDVLERLDKHEKLISQLVDIIGSTNRTLSKLLHEQTLLRTDATKFVEKDVSLD